MYPAEVENTDKLARALVVSRPFFFINFYLVFRTHTNISS